MDGKRIGFKVNHDIYNKLQELKIIYHGASDRQLIETLIDREYKLKKEQS